MVRVWIRARVRVTVRVRVVMQLTLVPHALAQPASVRRAQLSIVSDSVARFHPVASVARLTWKAWA